MKMWEAGAPIEGGNDTGIPDIKYFNYLKDRSYDGDYNSEYADSEPEVTSDNFMTFDEIIEIADESFDMGIYGKALDYYYRALNCRYSEETESKKAQCLQKLGRNDESSQAYFHIGYRNAWHGGNKNIAIKYYKKSLECDSNNDEALKDLGYQLRMLKRYSEALDYYKHVRSEDVGWAMARCYMGLKQYENAIPLLDKYIKECPYCDDYLDEKCECLIGLNRKTEAVKLWKDFILFLMKKECYGRALKRLDLLCQNTNNENIFIEDMRVKCLKEKENLEIRFRAIYNVMTQYHMYNPNGLDENDLKGFIKFVCEKSGESVDDIVRWYNTPMLDSSSFASICGECLHYTHWETITKMYEQGKFGDL